MNNFSLLAANRLTHLKVVAVALVFATLAVGIGFAARVTDGAGTAAATVARNEEKGRIASCNEKVSRPPLPTCRSRPRFGGVFLCVVGSGRASDRASAPTRRPAAANDLARPATARYTEKPLAPGHRLWRASSFGAGLFRGRASACFAR